MKEDFLHKKLGERIDNHAFRELRLTGQQVDFCSNDYLGIARNKLLTQKNPRVDDHGSTGSRLLTGNYELIEATERLVAAFHQAEAGLIFNSGYDANIGLLSCVPQRGDTIIYDRLCHASIRDGIRLSFAEALAFDHNDLDHLEKRLAEAKGTIFVVTESVFSMDGDFAPLGEITQLCERFGGNLIVDEAHATGVIGEQGEGLVQKTGLSSACFARVHTFGKALGCHGAIVLGSSTLREYLINFCRPFIFSTALPPSNVNAISVAYSLFPGMHEERTHIQRLASRFQKATFSHQKLVSNSAIQGVIIPGNRSVRETAQKLQATSIDVRPILYPTVPKGSERLRIVLHSFNTEDELVTLLDALS